MDIPFPAGRFHSPMERKTFLLLNVYYVFARRIIPLLFFNFRVWKGSARK